MSTGSNIEWTEATWTPVKGCTRVSAGCDHCYAVTMTHRLEKMAEKDVEWAMEPGAKSKYVGLTVLNGRGERHFNGKVVLDADALTVPLHWKKPRTIFVSSMSDIFHKDVPFEFLDRIMATIMVAKRHTFQVLTKRPERAAEYFAARPMGSWIFDFPKGHPQEGLAFKPPEWPPKNVWLGTSIESDEHHARAWELLKCPAVVRFLSLEPLLGPVDLDRWELLCRAWSERRPTMGKYIDWVIVGGESGPKARPCDVAWIRSIVQQCKAAGVPCFVKQLGACVSGQITHPDNEGYGVRGVRLEDKKGGDMAEWPEDLRVREMPASSSPEAKV